MPNLSTVLRSTNIRNISAIGSPTPPSEQTVVQWPEDFTYLGAFAVPRNVGGAETVYGNSFSLKPEPLDVSNPKHFLSTSYGDGALRFGVYEARIISPTIGTGYDPGQYTECTVAKVYGRQPYTDSEDQEHFPDQMLDGSNGVKWDAISQKMLWNYNTGYASTGAFGFASLDYNAGTAVAEGWGYTLSNQGPKAVGTGFYVVPADFADAYLGGEDIVGGWGGYYSVVGDADCSLGPSLTGVPRDMLTSPPDSSFVGTPLVGYWNTVGSPDPTHGRGNRPEPEEYVIQPDWGLDKWDWNDRCDASVFIWTPTKRGSLFFGRYGRKWTQYISSLIRSNYYGHYAAVYDPLDFTPISSTPRYELQPDIANYQFPVIDYSTDEYATPTDYKTITSIVSNASKLRSSSDGCLVTCVAHGYSTGNVVLVSGSEPEFNYMWQISVADADSFYIYNTSVAGNWSGDSDSSPGMEAVKGAQYEPENIFGADFDYTTNILYIFINKFYGVNNVSGKALVMAYQLNG